jgi:ribonuclease Y
VIDETPGSIMISGFSPMRRQVAKHAIERLVKDGRINPVRIEEAIEEAKKTINKDIYEAGEAVVYDLNIVDFPEKLISHQLSPKCAQAQLGSLSRGHDVGRRNWG